MSKLNLEQIGKHIKKIRIENNLTQEQLACLLHVTKSSVSQWEKGNGISVDNLYSTAKLFCIDIDDLISGNINKQLMFSEKNMNILKNIDVNKVLESRDYEILQYYCNYIFNMKKQIIKLLEKWALDTLTETDASELKLFESFAYFFNEGGSNLDELIYNEDHDVYAMKIKKTIASKFENLKSKTTSEIEYEISKFFQMKYEFNITDIIENKKDLKALNIVLSQMFQHEKDELFMRYIFKYSSLDEFENYDFYNLLKNDFRFNESKLFEESLRKMEFDKVAKIFIDENCNVLYPENFMDYAYFYKLPCDYFPDKYKRIECEEYNYDFVKGWREFSYIEYKKMINPKYTKFLKNLINNKENNPLKYYKDLLDIFKL